MLSRIGKALLIITIICSLGVGSFPAVNVSDSDKPVTNADFANLLIGATGIELPPGSEDLSDEEFFEVQANMLAESDVTTKFMDWQPATRVTRGMMADVLFEVLKDLPTFDPDWNTGKTVKVLAFSGSVNITPASTGKTVPCGEGMFLGEGTRIQTGAASSVEIGFDIYKKNVVKILENTDVVLKLAGRDKIELIDGKVVTLVRGLAKGSEFRIRTMNACCGARGTGWEIHKVGQNTFVASFDGKVFVFGVNPDGSLMGQMFWVNPGFLRAINGFQNPGNQQKLSQSRLRQIIGQIRTMAGDPTMQDIINYLSMLGFLQGGNPNHIINFGDLARFLNNPALARAIAEAYGPPGRRTRRRGAGAPGVTPENPASPI